MNDCSDPTLNIFRQSKILTLNELALLLRCSDITARRRLKHWGSYTSYNCNGRYYTLNIFPKFNKHGIWKYKNVYFSKWGTLHKTLNHLIENSASGLNATEAKETLGLEVQNLLSQQYLRKQQFQREKNKGIYIYYSKDPTVAQTQKQARYKSFPAITASDLPTEAEAIIILIELIKHPNDTVEQLYSRAKYRGLRLPFSKIRGLLSYHGLLKKTLEQKH